MCDRMRSLSPNQSEDHFSSFCENSGDETFYSLASQNVELLDVPEFNNNNIVFTDNAATMNESVDNVGDDNDFKKKRRSTVYQSVNAKHFSFMINKPKSLKLKPTPPPKNGQNLSAPVIANQTHVSRREVAASEKLKEQNKPWGKCFMGNKYKHLCGVTVPVSPLSPAYDYATLNNSDKKLLDTTSAELKPSSPRVKSISPKRNIGSNSPNTFLIQKVLNRRAKSAEREKPKKISSSINVCVECGFDVHSETITIKGCVLHRECFKCAR